MYSFNLMVAFDERVMIDLHLVVASAQRFQRRLSEQRLSYPGNELSSLCSLSLDSLRKVHEREGNQALLRQSYPLVHGLKTQLHTSDLLENKHVARLMSHIDSFEQHGLWETTHDTDKLKVMKQRWMLKNGKDSLDGPEWNMFLQKFSQHLHRNGALPRHDRNFLLLPEKRLMVEVNEFLKK